MVREHEQGGIAKETDLVAQRKSPWSRIRWGSWDCCP